MIYRWVRVKLHSEQISKRLFISVLIIVLSLLCLSVPLILNQYQNYIKAKRALIDIESLKAVADLANRISRERGPANMAMSSTPEQIEQSLKDLAEYRKGVDQQLEDTFQILAQAGFSTLNHQPKQDLITQLQLGRHYVDHYIQTPFQNRNAEQLDAAIVQMYGAWDKSCDILKKMVTQSVSKDSKVADSYTLILILADLRDQAGRLASNVMAHVTFGQPLPSDNIARALQTEKQVKYLWDLIYTIQPEQDKTEAFNQGHQLVKQQFIDRGIPIVLELIQESENQRPYSLKGTELTIAISDKFLTVIDFQKYLLDYSVEKAKAEKQSAQRLFTLMTLLSLISLFAALFIMFYAQRRIFAPLIEARDLIVELSFSHTRDGGKEIEHEHHPSYSLYDALHKLQYMLKQRDAFEFELKSIANTDNLTGVLNRVALDDYLRHAGAQPQHFQQLCLIIVDIDNFKQVNDQYGHIFGDQVIVSVAKCLKENVRSTDLIIRFGGDEFLILLSEIEVEQTMQSAEKIRQAVADLNLLVPDTGRAITVSVSIGLAVGAENWMELLAQADRSLFKAKARGKNTVEGL